MNRTDIIYRNSGIAYECTSCKDTGVVKKMGRWDYKHGPCNCETGRKWMTPVQETFPVREKWRRDI